MQTSGFIFLKKAPFIKLLLPLMAGIILQWHLQIALNTWMIIFLFSLLILLVLFLLPVFERFRYASVNGIIISVVFLSLGATLAWYKDIRHNKQWIGNFYKENDAVLVTLQEPLSEKTKSYKALAAVTAIGMNEKIIPVKGNIILYFQKDLPDGQAGSLLPDLHYGSQIVFTKPLQTIKNSGNPGSFDYGRYCLFQDISYQAYLKPGDFTVLSKKNEHWFGKFIVRTREKVLAILRNNIKSEKELGLAEALLIGYKDDLDKPLVQSYSNTGVVHVIAISGLHLGLIYWLLVLLLKPVKRRKNLRWLNPLLIISSLWLFSLLAGAQPSVLRSAVMFTCIVLGENFSRRTTIYNTLAFSAFLLLCYNPYWLWDVGFQLSYAAVLSIVIFMQTIYNWFYIKNKILDFIWKLNAVTIAAQILTVPLSLYHFHQFPNFFLITNFIAVPLSSIIVLGEILLCAVSVFPAMAMLIGKILSGLIWLLNTFIERIDSLPFAIWDGIQITIPQTILLIITVTGISYWLMEKQKNGFITGLIALLAFSVLRSYSFSQVNNQKKLIVYNVPQHPAIDFISGRKYVYSGDTALLTDDFLRNFHIKPSRVLHRIEPVQTLSDLFVTETYFQFCSKRIMQIEDGYSFEKSQQPLAVDVLILSRSPKIYLNTLTKYFTPGIIVFDGSDPSWKIKYWKKDCDSLHIPYYDVNEKGAFVMKLN